MTFDDFIWNTLYIQSELIRTPQQQEELMQKGVYIAGIGGHGSGLINIFGRIGIGHFCLSDPDVYDVTNLNRQLLANSDTIGINKAVVAAKQLESINPFYDKSRVNVLEQGTTLENYIDSTEGYSVIINQPDKLSIRLMLEAAAKIHKTTTIRGARKNWPDRLTVGVNIRDYSTNNIDIQESYDPKKWGVEAQLFTYVLEGLLNGHASAADLEKIDSQNSIYMRDLLINMAQNDPTIFGYDDKEYALSRIAADPIAYKRNSDPFITAQTALLISFATYSTLLGLDIPMLDISLHRGKSYAR